MRERRWVVAQGDRDAGARLARDLDIAPLTANLLVNRGVLDARTARRFLEPDLSELIDPLRFRDMGAAVDRLARAVRDGEKIGIFGDYDVDGASGTAIVAKILRLLGADPAWKVPHRVKDGYGLNAKAIEEFADDGVTVMITIDCGTRNGREIALAKSRGIDVIVLDHHEAGKDLPPAVAVVNPKRKDSTYGFTGICSAGLSFKLAWALADRTGARSREGFQGFILDAMGLAALGTVADVCPLLGENRVFVRFGLDALRACGSPGLRALMETARVQGRPLDPSDLGFRLAPRLNALGRLGTAMDCVELLVSSDEARIGEILKVLEKSNRTRKGIEDKMCKQAIEQVEERGVGDGALIVADERWHLGVVGIVAARLVDRYYRPAFVLAIDEEGVAKGSARSIEGFALHEALAECGHLLMTHGGHAMAAGLSLRREDLETFRDAMNECVGRTIRPDQFKPTLELDGAVSIGEVTRPVVRELGRLAPHGPGNPEPVLAAEGVKVAGEPRLMGRRGDHLSFFVSGSGGASVRAVGFKMGGRFDAVQGARRLSLAFTPRINAWQGRESVELHLVDLKINP